jgi:hypothetical protein
MAASIYYYDIDLNKNKLLNARLHPVTTAERTTLGGTYNSADKGILVYDSTESLFYGWDGNIWRALGLSATDYDHLNQAYDAIIVGVDVTSDNENLYLTLHKRDESTISDSLKFKHIHTQTVTSSEWIIEHNLNCYPSVTIVDASNSEVIGEVEYITTNSLKAKFSASFSGKAYLN